MRSAVGFGVRYKSPVGPIRVDLGFKVHREVIAGAREGLTALRDQPRAGVLVAYGSSHMRG